MSPAMSQIAGAEGGGDYSVLFSRAAIVQQVQEVAGFLFKRFGQEPFVLANLGEEGTYFKVDLLQILGPLGALVTSASFDIRNVGYSENAHLIRPVGNSPMGISDQHVVLAQGRIISGGTAQFAADYIKASHNGQPGAKTVTVVSLIGTGKPSEVSGLPVHNTPIAGYCIPPLPHQLVADPGLGQYTYHPQVYYRKTA